MLYNIPWQFYNGLNGFEIGEIKREGMTGACAHKDQCSLAPLAISAVKCTLHYIVFTFVQRQKQWVEVPNLFFFITVNYFFINTSAF